MLNPLRSLVSLASLASLGSVGSLVAATRLEPLRRLGDSCKPVLRDSVAGLLSRVGATRPARFARGALTVVTFHRVLPKDKLRSYPLPGLAVTPEQLEQVLGRLSVHFSCMPLIEAYRLWQEGRTAERPPLAVTFDDGALDNHEHALPVLKRLGVRASFYIPVSNVDEQRAPWHDRLGFALLRSVGAIRKRRDVDFDPLLEPFGLRAQAFAAVLPDEAVAIAGAGVARAKALSLEQRTLSMERLEAVLGGDQVPDWAGLMSWDQIRELGRAGHEIGSHSLTHPILPDCSADQLRAEIASSRARLAAATGAEVASFCYPNGSYDARCLDEVLNAGYACAVTTRPGLNRLGTPRFELRRCDMDYARLGTRRGEFSEPRLFLRLSGLGPGMSVASPY